MRIRLNFTKLGKVRFSSHRDLARVWERAIRTAGLPVAYTEGFSPRPKLHFGLALPTGAESLADYIDADLTADVDLDPLAAVLTQQLPSGLDVTDAVAIERSVGSLQEAVVAANWRLTLAAPAGVSIDAELFRVLASEHLMLQRSRKGTFSTDDVRSSIESAHPTVPVDNDSGDPTFDVCLKTGGRSLRPSEFVQCLFPGCDWTDHLMRVVRTHQWIELDGQRHEPLAVARALERT